MKPIEYLFWLGEHVPKGQEGTGIVSPVKPETLSIMESIVSRFYEWQSQQFMKRFGYDPLNGKG